MTDEILEPTTPPEDLPLPTVPEPNPEIITRLWELDRHKHEREILYGALSEQLDMLYKDIDAGKFGESAKTGTFYLHIKSVKDAVAKVSDEDKTRIEAELETLFQQEGE